MPRKISGEVEQIMEELYAEGLSITKIARIANISYTIAYRYTKAKQKGFKSLREYREHLLKQRGFKSRREYEKYLLKQRGFNSCGEYKKWLAKQRGFNSYTEYLKHMAKQRQKQLIEVKIMPNERKALHLGDYVFLVTPNYRSIIVETKYRSKEELELISKLYQENIAHKQLKGEFRYCERDGCKYAFYARPDNMDKANKARYHSSECFILNRQKNFLNWFLNLPFEREAGWILDRLLSPNPKSKYLKLLVEREPKKVAEILHEICAYPYYPVARRIVEERGKWLLESLHIEKKLT